MAEAHKNAWRIDRPLTIGEVDVDPTANEICCHGQVSRLRPILMDVLLRLATVPGEVVSRDELISDVWSRRMVNDEVLSRAVAELRTLLGDDAKQPRYIETLPKVGYRLIAVVRLQAPPSGALPANVGGAAAPTRETVPSQTPSAPQAPRPRSISRTAVISIAVLVGLVITGVFMVDRTPSDSPATVVATAPATLALQIARAESFSADADFESSPRFSSDGKRVVYAQGDDRETHLVVRDVGGGIVKAISKQGALMLAPVFGRSDASVIYFERTKARCGFVERQLDTGQERGIIDCAREPRHQFDVSPDHTHLAISMRHRADFPLGIARVKLLDGSIEMLTTPQPGEGDDLNPRFSPDGKRLVFSRGTSSHSKLWLLSLAAPSSPPTPPTPLLAVAGLDYGVAWMSRDGPLLVSADWSGSRALNLVDIASGKIDAVGGRGARYPDVAPTGDIVFESAHFRADLWLTDAANPGAEVRALWPSSRYSNQPVFSPDGKRVVFVSNREGAGALYVGEIDGAIRKLTPSPDDRHIRPHWSSDGRSLFAVRSAVGRRDAGPNEAVRINVTNGTFELLLALGQQVADVRELPDGGLLVAEAAENAMRLSRFADGRLQRLPFPLVSEFQSYGDELVFMQPGLTSLTRCQLSTYRCAPLAMAIAESERFHWHLGDKVLWYRQAANDTPPKLMKLDLVSGKIRAFDFAPTGYGTSIAASPDGRHLIVSREAPPTVDLVLARKR
jgi:DNA-binding winged helix-turn-helix (wHTH) protein/Tol biopolymer transport system component